jgi:hypothetical protein
VGGTRYYGGALGDTIPIQKAFEMGGSDVWKKQTFSFAFSL